MRSDHQCGKDRRLSDNAWELLNSRECGEVKRERNKCRGCPLGRTRVHASTSKLQLGGLLLEAAANCAAWHRRSDCEERREIEGEESDRYELEQVDRSEMEEQEDVPPT